MTDMDCGCNVNCSGLAIVASVIIGIITSFLVYNAAVAVTSTFLWVLFGIAVVWLALLMALGALSQSSGFKTCLCSGMPLILTGFLGTILVSLILLAVSFPAASVAGAIIKGALLLFFTLGITSAACLIRCSAGCGAEQE